jgi:hypothetical protein
MQVIHRCCCGLDVHKKLIVACLISMNAAGERMWPSRALASIGNRFGTA